LNEAENLTLTVIYASHSILVTGSKRLRLVTEVSGFSIFIMLHVYHNRSSPARKKNEIGLSDVTPLSFLNQAQGPSFDPSQERFVGFV
jgi:hypothetical protein